LLYEHYKGTIQYKKKQNNILSLIITIHYCKYFI